MNIFTRGDDGTLVYYENTGSTTQQRYTSNISISGEIAIDMQIMDNSQCRHLTARLITGALTEYDSVSITGNGNLHIEIKTNGTYWYYNGTQLHSITTQTNLESVTLYVRLIGNSTTNFKYKDLRIYYI